MRLREIDRAAVDRVAADHGHRRMEHSPEDNHPAPMTGDTRCASRTTSTRGLCLSTLLEQQLTYQSRVHDTLVAIVCVEQHVNLRRV